MFCVKCGAEDEETIDGLCLECFLNGRKLLKLPHHVDLFRCTNCEEYQIGDQWVEMSQNKAVEDIAVTQLAVIPEAKVLTVGSMSSAQDEKTFIVRIEVDMDISGRLATDSDETIVRLKNSVCKRCSRQLGNYYEAIMQIRTGEKELTDEMRDEIVRKVRDQVELQARNNRQLFITRVEEVSGGVDIYLSSISLGRTLTKDVSDSYGAESRESSSLVGMTPDGNDMYRLTFLVRLPIYHTGDVVIYGGKACKLSGVNKNGGKIIDLTTFQERSVRKTELQSLKTVYKPKEFHDATVVSVSDREIQVLHPSNYSTVDIRIPEGTPIGETVRVVDVENELFFVP